MFDFCFAPRITTHSSLEGLIQSTPYQEAYVTQHPDGGYVAREVSWKSPLWENCCITSVDREQQYGTPDGVASHLRSQYGLGGYVGGERYNNRGNIRLSFLRQNVPTEAGFTGLGNLSETTGLISVDEKVTSEGSSQGYGATTDDPESKGPIPMDGGNPNYKTQVNNTERVLGQSVDFAVAASQLAKKEEQKGNLLPSLADRFKYQSGGVTPNVVPVSNIPDDGTLRALLQEIQSFPGNGFLPEKAKTPIQNSPLTPSQKQALIISFERGLLRKRFMRKKTLEVWEFNTGVDLIKKCLQDAEEKARQGKEIKGPRFLGQK